MSKEKYPEQPILIVDDDKDFPNSIKPPLRKNGITNVEFCHDSREVMNRLKQKEYSIILLDILMPGIRGDELLPAILKEYPNQPIILLTALGEESLAMKCLHKGATDYIVKGAPTYRMIYSIKNALKQIKTQKEYLTLKESLLSETLNQPDQIQTIISESENTKKIFISYSHQDQEFANRLVNDLKNAGMEVWIDEKEIKVGSSIPEEIKQGISRCHFFCVILSRHSVESPWVEKECKMALNAQKQSSLFSTPRLLPILMQDIELPMFLKDIRCAEFLWNYDRGLNQILDAIKSCNLNITA